MEKKWTFLDTLKVWLGLKEPRYIPTYGEEYYTAKRVTTRESLRKRCKEYVKKMKKAGELK